MKPQHIKSIFFCILSSIIYFQHADAQIVYTDINPDVTTSGSYNLDINNDSITDFTIVYGTSSTSHICNVGGFPNPCSGTRTNRFLKVQAATGNSLLSGTLLTNTVIDQNAVLWTTSKSLASSTYTCSCNIFGSAGWHLGNSATTGGYIGLKFVAGGQTYYGWLRFHAKSSPMSCTLYDFGYNASVGNRILTGQTVASNYVFVTPMGGTMCSGSNFNVPYTLEGSFNASNIVTAQLSDASGSFTSPVNIGSAVNNISGIINATIPVSTLAGTTYRIRITTSNPVKLSSDFTTTTNNGINLIVNTSLPTSVITTSSSTNVCNGNVVLTTTTANGNTYQWKLNGNTITGATLSNYPALVPGDYTCIKTNGCGSSTSNIITVTSTASSVTISASGATTTCGSNISLNTAYGTGNTYQWKLNGNNITNATSYLYTATQSGIYSCIRTNICGSVPSNNITIIINPLPAVITIAAASATTACTGPDTLSAPAIAGVTYQWYFSAVAISGATTELLIANSSGSYYLKETNSYGCSRNSNGVSLLLGNPVATISPTTGKICHGNPVSLYAYPSGSIYSYQWKKNGVDISGATNQSYSTTHSATYTARVTLVSGGCSTISSGTVVTNGCRTTDNNYGSDNIYSLNVAPNPANGSAEVSFSLLVTQYTSIKLFDMNGRVVNSIVDGMVEEGETAITMSVSELNAGIYLLLMETGEHSTTQKISVIK